VYFLEVCDIDSSIVIEGISVSGWYSNVTSRLVKTELHVQSKCQNYNYSKIKKQIFVTDQLEFGEEGACVPNKPDCIILTLLTIFSG
jgi:hypothetical protein